MEKMNVAVLGAGIEGQSLIKYFLKRGARITLHDQKDLDKTKFQGIAGFVFGEHYLDALEQYDFVFRSPGIPFLTPALQRAIQRGAKITSLTKYFFEHCPAKIIGVTGTKGKGTTSTLLYEILKEHIRLRHSRDSRVFFGGNIGKSPLEFLDELTSRDTVILELSSFQLQDLGQSPSTAVILSITEDHLDHHKTMEEYVEAKRNILRFQKSSNITILTMDKCGGKSFTPGFLNDVVSKEKWLIRTEKTGEDRGGYVEGDMLFLSSPTSSLPPLPFMKISEIPLLGRHNLGNVLAASAAAAAHNVPFDTLRKVIRTFKGLPHRLEFVAEIDGVKFYNDSASTNPNTTIAALRSFGQSLILIAGGSEKFVHYGNLGEEIIRRTHVKAVILMGQTSKRIEQAIDEASEKVKEEIKNSKTRTPKIRLRDIPLEIIKAENYQEAFMAAKLLAQKGDIVLLSPASASFDMFSGYQERGEIFKAFVKNLG